MSTINKVFFLFVFLFFIITSIVYTQTIKDVVYLKNGSIVKGTIIEMIPNQSIKIQTGDGSIFVYSMAEIDRITKEEVSKSTGSFGQGVNLFSGDELPAMFSIFGGISLPVGDFSKEEDNHSGGAKTGFTAGFQYVSSGGMIGYLLQLLYIQNSMKEWIDPFTIYRSSLIANGYNYDMGSWRQIQIFGGPKVGTTQKNGPNFFIAPLIGVNLCISPKITGDVSGSYGVSLNYSPYYTSVPITGKGEVPSIIEIAFAYGVATEFVFGNFSMGVKYLAAEPKYDIEGKVKFSGRNSYASISGEYSGKIKYEPNISVLLVYVGFVF
ncbi:MAG: hypothetical protein N3A63_10200 [Bacteroidetes bacterium]|nr:hypothetical protein [Bacteroidota bacterium]